MFKIKSNDLNHKDSSIAYILSFTSASLSTYESEIVANLFDETKDWAVVQKSVVDDNVIQKESLATRRRKFSEIRKRLELLTPEQISFYSEATSSDVKYLTLLACYKFYQFIFDFASQVIRNKLLLFDFQILNSDYESFYDSKRMAYDNLNTISEMTQKKLKQVMFKIFEQAGLIDSVKSKNIQKPYLSEELIKLIVHDDPKYLSAFLYSDNEIKDYIKRYE
ncbi:MAG: DUF1819 family protein [Campylobacterota bacterium]|nr:DUF1819 family protein [Campylobacterota bacterium]